MKKIFSLLLLPICCFSGIYQDLTQGPTNADGITFDWLARDAVQDHDTQHVLLFKKLFGHKKIKGFLEFGLGYPTKYFLDHCNKVISVDIITHGYGPEVMKKFLNLYRDYSNWIPVAMFSGYLGCEYSWAPYKHMASDSIYKAAAYSFSYRKNYAKIDNFYIVELNAFIANLLKYNNIDVAFVAHANFVRGEIVQLLFNRVPVIIAHNTNKRHQKDQDDIYGLVRVETPNDYEEIFFPFVSGTTAWVLKNEKNKGLIEELKKFAEEL